MGNPLDVILEPSEARGSGKWPIKGFEDQKSFGNLPGEFLKLRKVEGDSQSPRNTWQDTESLARGMVSTKMYRSHNSRPGRISSSCRGCKGRENTWIPSLCGMREAVWGVAG